MESPPPPNKLPSFSARAGVQTADSQRAAAASGVEGGVADSETADAADGGQSPDFCEAQDNEQDKPASPYPPGVRTRLRRVKPLS